MLTIHEICEATGGQLLGNPIQNEVSSFHFDTRLLTSGAMFIALTGGTRDGHEFLDEAHQQGAIAALISNLEIARQNKELAYVHVQDTEQAFAQLAEYYRKKLTIPVIAVTGSNGKTTTKDIIAHVLGYKKKVFKTFKNLNNHLGVPLSILQIKEDDELAVLEMGMNHAGEIDFLASIAKPNISVITNVTDAHIEHLGSKENIAKAKAELLLRASKDGFAILNGDNPYVVAIRDFYPGKAYFYRLNGAADIFASELETNDHGTSFLVTAQGVSYPFTIPMFGEHNVSNTLAAIWIALQFDYNLEEINASLQTLSISPMRFELVRYITETTVINDAYNASPTSMKNSIRTFSEILPKQKKILVLGDMYELGADSEKYHQEVGLLIDSLKERFELLVTVGNEAQAISDARALKSRHFTNRSEAAHFLASIANHDYAFLFKASRGMRLEELIQEMTDLLKK
ncbi:hypothetical protein BEP19_06150 [Ammoniphilus oxalaticus]|uniref:UDP-N-acetylmuramoyl-tripeptide--D-alanyl-D-alanine ligase n=1 Tax=Ammoniphilus oxalaticus TaxID=66863 RepID=A0A419SJ52_9BACL|nr:UDP-N-acetylmuramoyl-tripeptide--D-alanyl-D-alanine ligase [Ammoniphilus oxalaticus]RKD23997.1 hypothetical protein BEP19_06150 [Ammoniphilus oxalaticus]